MKAAITKSVARGSVRVPASKSYAHRRLICAALAEGESRICGVDENRDVLATAECLSALGASVRFEGTDIWVRGCGGAVRGGGRLDCCESGSTLRFLVPVALLGGGGEFVGSQRLMARGISVYEQVFADRGIKICPQADRIEVSGKLTAGDYTVPGNVSSQFISGLLFALPLLDGKSTVTVTDAFESRAYVDLTLDVLAQSGVKVTVREGHVYEVSGNGRYAPQNGAVEGDWSQAAFFFALNALGGDVSVCGLREDSRQGDRVCLAYLKRLTRPGAVLDLSDCPDLAPVLFAVAVACHGGVFEGTARLAIKESDRAAVMAEELAKFGADISVFPNRVEVRPAALHAPACPLSGHNDHRVVMALSVLATRTGGMIEGAEAISKSYPGFFDALRGLGVEVKTDD